jgi:hypothetical protein
MRADDSSTPGIAPAAAARNAFAESVTIAPFAFARLPAAAAAVISYAHAC